MLICATCLKRKRKQHTQKWFSTMKENTICTAAYDTMEDHFKKSLPQTKDSNSFLFYNDDCSVGLVMAWRSIIGYENKSPKKKKNSYPCGGTICVISHSLKVINQQWEESLKGEGKKVCAFKGLKKNVTSWKKLNIINKPTKRKISK